MAANGGTSLVLGFKLTQENDDLLSSFGPTAPCERVYYTSILFSAKSIKITRYILFEVPGVPKL